MRAILVVLFAFLLQYPAMADSGSWRFSKNIQSWGLNCVAEVRQGGLTVGFYGAPGGEMVAFVRGVNLPRNARSVWQINGKEWRQFEGVVDPYNGYHVFWGVPQSFLSEIAAGRSFNLYVQDAELSGNARELGSNGITLKNSARSIAAFRRCQASYSSPHHSVQAIAIPYQSR